MLSIIDYIIEKKILVIDKEKPTEYKDIKQIDVLIINIKGKYYLIEIKAL